MIIGWWDDWTHWHRPNVSNAQEFKDSIKTTPGRARISPGNPPLYGCLTSSPWRDHSHYESCFVGNVDVMPKLRSQLLCWAIHFNDNQISSATKYLAKSCISLRRFMSRGLLIVSTNKHSAHRVIEAHGVQSPGDPRQTILKKQKGNRGFWRIYHHNLTARRHTVWNRLTQQTSILGVSKWKALLPPQHSKVHWNIKCVPGHVFILDMFLRDLSALKATNNKNIINVICLQLYLCHLSLCPVWFKKIVAILESLDFLSSKLFLCAFSSYLSLTPFRIESFLNGSLWNTWTLIKSSSLKAPLWAFCCLVQLSASSLKWKCA